eukprot:4981499-Pyramimonas_sp.AAC.1
MSDAAAGECSLEDSTAAASTVGSLTGFGGGELACPHEPRGPVHRVHIQRERASTHVLSSSSNHPAGSIAL